MQDNQFLETVKAKIFELETSNEGVKLYKSLQGVLYALESTGETSMHINGNNLNGKKSTLVVDDNKSHKKVVAELIKGAGRFLHIREIVELAKEKHPTINEKSIKQAVYGLKTDKAIVSYAVNNSNQNTFWGSPKWINADGSIKPEYMYDEKQVTNNSKEIIEI